MLHGELPPEYELAANSALQLLLAFTRPPRPGRILTVVGNGTYTVEMDDPDGGTATAWGLNGFTYAVSDVVYILFAANTPDSGIIVGGKAPIPTLDHGASLTGKTDDDHTQYALLAGRATGQTLNGGTASGDDLTLDSTAHATKGDILLNPSGGNVGIGTSAPLTRLSVAGIRNTTKLTLDNTSNDGSWSNTDEIGAIEFYSRDVSAGGPKIVSAIRSIQANNTFGGWARLAFDVSGNSGTAAEAMTLTHQGRLGIGTNSPAHELDIRDPSGGAVMQLKSEASGNAAILMDAHTTDPYIRFLEQATDKALIGFDTSEGELKFNVGTELTPSAASSPALLIDANDNLRLLRGTSGVGSEGNKLQWGWANGPYITSVQTASDSDGQGFAIYTHPSATGADPPVEKIRINHTGRVGIGTTSPQGHLHLHDGTGGDLFVTKTGVAGTAVTLIPDATGDVTAAVYISGITQPSSGASVGAASYFLVGDDLAWYDDGAGNTVNIRVNANGSVDIRRTAGSKTYTVALHLTWI